MIRTRNHRCARPAAAMVPKVSFSDPMSGSFDGDVQQGLDSGAPVVHVHGTFGC